MTSGGPQGSISLRASMYIRRRIELQTRSPVVWLSIQQKSMWTDLPLIPAMLHDLSLFNTFKCTYTRWMWLFRLFNQKKDGKKKGKEEVEDPRTILIRLQVRRETERGRKMWKARPTTLFKQMFWALFNNEKLYPALDGPHTHTINQSQPLISIDLIHQVLISVP